jgi:hypothetical protein
MRRLTILAAFSVLSVLASACGKPFTAAQGGSGGGGSSNGSGGSSGAGVTTSTDIPGSCDPNSAFACAGDEFCKTSDCKTGACTKKPGGEGAKWAPVCGCNGIAYWNRDLAFLGGAAYREGACDLDQPPAQMVKCYENNAGVCQTAGAGCYLHSQNDCLDTPTGVCMVVPTGCPGITEPSAFRCGQTTTDCPDLCHLVTNAKRWFAPPAAVCKPPP